MPLGEPGKGEPSSISPASFNRNVINSPAGPIWWATLGRLPCERRPPADGGPNEAPGAASRGAEHAGEVDSSAPDLKSANGGAPHSAGASSGALQGSEILAASFLGVFFGFAILQASDSECGEHFRLWRLQDRKKSNSCRLARGYARLDSSGNVTDGGPEASAAATREPAT